MQTTKHRLFGFCMAYVEEKIVAAKLAMENAQKEANLETKSSAGDKYETGRSMMQLEKEKYALHLQEALRLKSFIEQIDPNRLSEQVETGALIETDHGNFFVAIAAGRLVVDKEYICISIASPLGRALESAEEEDVVVFRDKEIEILSIS